MIFANPEREAQVVKQFRLGKTMAQIALEYGVTREAVRKLLKRNGFTGKGFSPFLDYR